MKKNHGFKATNKILIIYFNVQFYDFLEFLLFFLCCAGAGQMVTRIIDTLQKLQFGNITKTYTNTIGTQDLNLMLFEENMVIIVST